MVNKNAIPQEIRTKLGINPKHKTKTEPWITGSVFYYRKSSFCADIPIVTTTPGAPDTSSLLLRIQAKSDACNDPSESSVVFPGSSECPINSPKESVIDIFKKLRYSVPHGAGV